MVNMNEEETKKTITVFVDRVTSLSASFHRLIDWTLFFPFVTQKHVFQLNHGDGEIRDALMGTQGIMKQNLIAKQNGYTRGHA